MTRKRRTHQASKPPKNVVSIDGARPEKRPTPLTTIDKAKEERRQKRLAEAAAARRRRQLIRWGQWAAVAVVVIGVVAWYLLRSGSEPEQLAAPEGLPGPRGGPSVAQDVNSLIGQPAPAFTLSDSEGTNYDVTPDSDRPTVLVFHMGIT